MARWFFQSSENPLSGFDLEDVSSFSFQTATEDDHGFMLVVMKTGERFTLDDKETVERLVSEIQNIGK